MEILARLKERQRHDRYSLSELSLSQVEWVNTAYAYLGTSIAIGTFRICSIPDEILNRLIIKPVRVLTAPNTGPICTELLTRLTGDEEARKEESKKALQMSFTKWKSITCQDKKFHSLVT